MSNVRPASSLSFLAVRVLERILLSALRRFSVHKLKGPVEELLHSDGRFVEWETLERCIVPVVLSSYGLDLNCTSLILYATIYLLHTRYRLIKVTQISALLQTPQASLGTPKGIGGHWKETRRDRRRTLGGRF